MPPARPRGQARLQADIEDFSNEEIPNVQRIRKSDSKGKHILWVPLEKFHPLYAEEIVMV